MNIQSLSITVLEVFTEIEKFNMDIVALIETRKKGKCTEEKQIYIND